MITNKEHGVLKSESGGIGIHTPVHGGGCNNPNVAE